MTYKVVKNKLLSPIIKVYLFDKIDAYVTDILWLFVFWLKFNLKISKNIKTWTILNLV